MNQLLTQSRVLNIILPFLTPKRKPGSLNGLIRRSTDTYATFCLTKVISKTGPDCFVWRSEFWIPRLKPLGVSPNTLLFGNAFLTDPPLLTQLDRDVSNTQPRSIRDFVDSLIERQKNYWRSYSLKRLLTLPNYVNDTKRIHGPPNFANVSKRIRMITLVAHCTSVYC